MAPYSEKSEQYFNTIQEVLLACLNVTIFVALILKGDLMYLENELGWVLISLTVAIFLFVQIYLIIDTIRQFLKKDEKPTKGLIEDENIAENNKKITDDNIKLSEEQLAAMGLTWTRNKFSRTKIFGPNRIPKMWYIKPSKAKTATAVVSNSVLPNVRVPKRKKSKKKTDLNSQNNYNL